MNKGFSLHICVSSLSGYYYGKSSPISSPEGDTDAYINLANELGYTSIHEIRNELATQKNVHEALIGIQKQAKSGDTVLITYCGHGTQLPDQPECPDETDQLRYPGLQDEVFCLYDLKVRDDDFGKWMEGFENNVTVYVITVACHSGNMLRLIETTEDKYDYQNQLPNETVQRYHRNIYRYPDSQDIKAGILHLSSCKDNQVTRDGNPMTTFTTRLIELLKLTEYNTDYITLLSELTKRVFINQEPTIGLAGHINDNILQCSPFKILNHK